MAVPKKRTGHSAQGKRRSNWKATKPELTTCPNCGAKVLTHTVCTACGQYKGKVVSRKAEGFVEGGKETAKAEVKEAKKTKKSTKKSAEPEVKAEEKIEEKAEEVKAEVEEKVEEEKAEAETIEAEEEKPEA